MKISVDDFARKYNVRKEKILYFLKMLKIDPNEYKEFDEEKLLMFIKMFK